MGIQIKAECKCGPNVEGLIVGGSRSQCGKIDPFPAVCNSCNNIVNVNTIDDTPKCPDCGSVDVTLYNDAALIGRPGFMKVAQNLDWILTNGTYKCPKCNEYTLQFERTAIFC